MTLIVTLNGENISARVIGSLSTYAQRGDTRTATFIYNNPPGVVNPNTFVGKAVAIDHVHEGVTRRIFTGWVDKPVYDFHQKYTTFHCSNRRKEQLDNVTRAQLDTAIGGYWSKHVFDEEATGSEYAAARLSTVNATLDYDAGNTLRLISNAPGTVDYSLGEPDISDQNLNVTWNNRDGLVNRVAVKFQYRYERLRHRERSFSWTHPHAGNNWMLQLKNPAPHVSRDMITQAINATGWVLKSAISFTGLPPAGTYQDATGTYLWSPIQSNYDLEYQKDADGNVETDADGNPIVESSSRTSQIDWTNKFATVADWTMATRFSQTITENYEITVEAPQSIDQFGAVDARNYSYGIEAEYDGDSWDDLQVYEAPTGTQSPNEDWVIDKDDTEVGGRSEFEAAVQAAIAKAKQDILNTHYRNYVDIVLPKQIASEYDLYHTLHIATASVACVARVYSIQHGMDIQTGFQQTNVRLALSLIDSAVSVTDAPVAIPTPPATTDAAATVNTIVLPTRIGNISGAPAYDPAWTGLTTNYINASGGGPTYPEAYVVEPDAVSDADRQEREVTAASTVDVEIPNNTLTVIN